MRSFILVLPQKSTGESRDRPQFEQIRHYVAEIMPGTMPIMPVIRTERVCFLQLCNFFVVSFQFVHLILVFIFHLSLKPILFKLKRYNEQIDRLKSILG